MLLKKNHKGTKVKILFAQLLLLITIIGVSFSIKASVAKHFKATEKKGNLEMKKALHAKHTGDAMQGDYYINNTQPTDQYSFNSFSDAADALLNNGVSGPVTFTVERNTGPYIEQVTLHEIPGASTDNTITFNGNGATLKFSPNADNTNPAVFTLNGADNVTLENLIVNAAPLPADADTHYGIGIMLNNHADNNTVYGCTVYSDTLTKRNGDFYDGIVLDGPGDHNVFNSNLTIGGYAGILVQRDATDIQLINNDVQRFYFTGIWVFNNGFTEDGILIENNRVAHSHRDGDILNGIFVTGVSNATISKNRVYDIGTPNESYGIYVSLANPAAGSKTAISNNLVYDISGINIGGIFAQASDGIALMHNTIALSYAGNENWSTAKGISFAAPATSNSSVIKNNIVTLHADGKGKNHAIWLSTAIPDLQIDYNDYFISGNAQNFIGKQAGDAAVLSDWQAMISQDAHSLSADPDYQNITTGFYRPRNAGIDNRGTPLGITTDIINAARSTGTPDMGAFEFTGCIPIHGVYTIDAGAAPGTSRTFQSFTDAYAAMHCGIDSAVVFNVKSVGHVYNEQLNMTAIDGASDVNTVTFHGNGNTIKFNSADEFHRAVLRFDGTSHFIFDSLIVDALPTIDKYYQRYGYGVQMYNGASNNIFHACTIMSDTNSTHNTENYVAVAILDDTYKTSMLGNHNKFDHNKIMGGNFNIHLYGKAIADSFINNDISKALSSGVILENLDSDNKDYSDSLLIEGNHIHNYITAGSIMRVNEANNVTINKNRIHDIKAPYGSTGIIIQMCNNVNTSKTSITNNLLYDIGPDSGYTKSYNFMGITFYCGNVHVLHNTIVIHNVTIDSASSSLRGIVDIFNTFDKGTTCYTQNNLVYIYGGGRARAACISAFDQSFTPSAHVIGNNNYYTDGNFRNKVGSTSGQVYVDSLSQWIALTKYDSASVSIDPEFIDMAAGNFKPNSRPMNDLGLPLGITTDIMEVSRSMSKPDLGAYEYDVCPLNFAKFALSNYTPCINENVIFKAIDTLPDGSAINTWKWDLGNGSTAATGTASTTYSKDGKYNVTLSATTDKGCKDDTTQAITVIDCEKQLYVPNAFSPNNDGNNDMLLVYGDDIKEMSLMIFNQWGEKIFESHDKGKGWDGTQSSKQQPSGVYMYVCKVTMTTGKEILRKGSINLIR